MGTYTDSELLYAARRHEALFADNIPASERPKTHLPARIGWMNDPNGFSYFQGRYHLFYQYYPYESKWGPMHWGHAVSGDLIRWEYLPAALAPDEPYDEEGCWSGSAAGLPDGRQLLIYTGREPFMADGRREIRQVQCLAVGDGVDYCKWKDNPVLSSKDLPEGAGIYDFRDPKVWQDEEMGLYYMVVGSRAADGFGQVLLYESRDCFSWQFVRVLEESRGKIGGMWECPDFFEIGKDAFLLLSPQDMKQEGEFLNRHGNAYLIGTYDRSSHTFTRREVHALDFGYDFYAAQTMKAPDGRRILIAWMQAWENARNRDCPFGWAGMMTVPRELSVRDGYLIQNPVRELSERRRNPVHVNKVPVGGRIRQEGVCGRCIDMTVEVSAGWNSDYGAFEIRFAEGEVKGRYFGVILRYDKEQEVITLDRSVSGYTDDALGLRRIERKRRAGSGADIRFRILLDRFSAEIFIDDGRYSMTSVISTPLEADGISFIAEGNAVINIEKYEIR